MIEPEPNDYKKYLENENFLQFVSQEFNDVSRHATLEELTEFAFGSVETAIEIFKENYK